MERVTQTRNKIVIYFFKNENRKRIFFLRKTKWNDSQTINSNCIPSMNLYELKFHIYSFIHFIISSFRFIVVVIRNVFALLNVINLNNKYTKSRIFSVRIIITLNMKLNWTFHFENVSKTLSKQIIQFNFPQLKYQFSIPFHRKPKFTESYISTWLM